LKRKKIIREYLFANKIKKLQLGCGDNLFNSWLNSDMFPGKNVIYLDVTKKFPFDDSTFDYVFSEHLIEHLDYAQGFEMLKECFRIIKPGGKIRISTPDLKFLIELYNEKKTKLQKDYLIWATKSFLKNINQYEDTFVINNFFKNWGHNFIYDFKVLRKSLEDTGFINITRFGLGKSNDPNLVGLESHGKRIGEKYNNLETFVIEGTKPSNK
jgi:predicted SAM-dependent methyltransferase